MKRLEPEHGVPLVECACTKTRATPTFFECDLVMPLSVFRRLAAFGSMSAGTIVMAPCPEVSPEGNLLHFVLPKALRALPESHPMRAVALTQFGVAMQAAHVLGALASGDPALDASVVESLLHAMLPGAAAVQSVARFDRTVKDRMIQGFSEDVDVTEVLGLMLKEGL